MYRPWHRINAKVASHVFSLLASMEGTTVCLEIPLQSPPPRETVTWRPSPPPHPGDRRALTREFARGGQGTSISLFGHEWDLAPGEPTFGPMSRCPRFVYREEQRHDQEG